MKLVMRLFQRKDWYYASFYRGKEKSLGTKDADLAKEIYRELKAEYLKGKLFHLEQFKKITLTDFRTLYIEKARAGMAAKTVRQDSLSLRLLEDVLGGSTQIRTLTPAKIDDFKRACIARKVKPRSVNSYLRHIKAALTYALDSGYIDKKPKIKMVPVGDALPHALIPEQIKLLLDKAKEIDIALWRYLMVCLWTGARRSEVLGLTWQAINLDKKQCRVIGKGNRERIIPLMPALVALLEPIKKDIGRLFSDCHADTYTHKFKRLAVACGIEDKHLHDLRHTAGTFMLKNGIPLEVVQKILGHSAIGTTQIYAKVLDDLTQSEMVKLRFE